MCMAFFVETGLAVLRTPIEWEPPKEEGLFGEKLICLGRYIRVEITSIKGSYQDCDGSIWVKN